MSASHNIIRGGITRVGVGALSGATALAQPAFPATTSPTWVRSSSTTLERNVYPEGVHHYRDPAEEARDAALITKAKIALAIDGVKRHAVVVDCDYSVARLGAEGFQQTMRSMRRKSPLPFLESRESITGSPGGEFKLGTVPTSSC